MTEKVEKLPRKDWTGSFIFPEEWVNRTILASELIDPSWDVVEFGAGSTNLKNFLKHSQRYLPTDLVQRDSSFQIVNLDEPLKLGSNFDVGVAIGVLEYVSHVESTLNEIARNLPNFVTTYCAAKSKFPKFILIRRYIGWKNHYAKREFEDIVHQAGYKILTQNKLEDRFLYSQHIYKLQKSNV
jgi:hypothetical protein